MTGFSAVLTEYQDHKKIFRVVSLIIQVWHIILLPSASSPMDPFWILTRPYLIAIPSDVFVDYVFAQHCNELSRGARQVIKMGEVPRTCGRNSHRERVSENPAEFQRLSDALKDRAQHELGRTGVVVVSLQAHAWM